MSCQTNIINLMHDYLDNDITEAEEKFLRQHLQLCSDCREHFSELKKAVALVQSTSRTEAPSDFTAKIINNLPKEKKTAGFNRWLRSHPLVSAASLFLLLMFGSIFSVWNENQEFAVTKQPNLLVENNTVIVPEGEVVEGDIVVRNGTIKIEGEVRGNVTVINGEISGDKYLASAGQVTGEIKEVNEIFEWIWYHLKGFMKETVQIFDKNDSEESTAY